MAEKVNVRINAIKKEDKQMELKNALVENEWFREDTDDDGEGEQEKEDTDKVEMFAGFGNMEGLSSGERFELMKFQIQMQMQKDQIANELEKERIRAEKEMQKEEQTEREDKS